MVGLVKGCLEPIFPESSGQVAKLIVDTVVAVALSALSFIAANAVERDSPGLATLFRVIPLGISLVWILRRFEWEEGAGGHVHHHHVAAAPVHHHHVAYAQPKPKHYFNFSWFPFWNSHPAPVHHYAPPPPVYQSPYQPAPPPPVVHYTTQSHAPQQAQTTYSVAQPVINPKSHAPAPVHYAQQPVVHPGNGFPAVIKAPAQPYGGGYSAAPQSHVAQQAQTTYSAAQPVMNPKSHAPAPIQYAQQPVHHGHGFPSVIQAPAQPWGGGHAASQPMGSLTGANKPLFPLSMNRQY